MKPGGSLSDFIAGIEHAGKRADSETLLALFGDATGLKPKLHGSMIGFGMYHYKYESGREGDAFMTGFAPRKSSLVIYIMGKTNQELLAKLGKHKTGSACIYINKLADVDLDVLKAIVVSGFEDMKTKYPDWKPE